MNDADDAPDRVDPGPGDPGPADPGHGEGGGRHGRSRALLVLALLLAVPVLLLAAGAWWFQRQLDPPGSPGPVVAVTIESGWGVSQIAGELDRYGVIDSRLAFQVYARFGGHDEFQAGDYELRRDLGVRAAVRVLEAGPTVEELELSVTPGRWLEEVATDVETQLGLDADRFVDVVRSGEIRSKYQPADVVSTEGLLYPDTYRFAEDVTEPEVVRTMVDRFDEIAGDLDLAEAAATTARTPYEVAIVASLIQSEAKLDEDRPLIASVVYNRLSDGSPLQIDATVLYAIGERKSSNTAEDRAIDSPYNTYKITGLPPTPIATIAEVSLGAALHPAITEFRFYVLSDPSGKHAFAVTYEEHLENVERARELGLLG